MNSHKKIYLIRMIVSLSNINADFLQLILCMLVSHYIIGNPLYGAALFLFSNIWILYFEGNLKTLSILRSRRNTNAIMWFLLSASVFAGLALVFLYPVVVRVSGINVVSFFVMLLAARSLLTLKINNALSKPSASRRVYKGIIQILFCIPCIFFIWLIHYGTVSWIILIGYAATGFLLSYQSSTMSSLRKYVSNFRTDKLDGISSYDIFSNMALYAQIALSLGMLMYVCYISFTVPFFSAGTYIMMAAWIIMVLVLSELFTRLVDRSGKALSVNMFIIGALSWIFGSIMVFNVITIWSSAFWTLFWGFGLACITSVLNRYNGDFKLVARLADRKVSDRNLYFRSLITQIVAVMISNGVMLVVLTIWVFVIPETDKPEISGLYKGLLIQLPVLFMIVSIFFALRQPLDDRSRQKLMNYSEGKNANKPTKQNLHKNLIDKKEVRFGVKIINFVVRPFLHLKVSGEENMDNDNFPSIFVCNHGIIYGPIAAVIYLPTYFRPWIDRKMVDRDMAAKEMCGRFIYRIPFLSDKAKMKLARKLAYPVTWALNSFNPIPVERNNLRNVMSTFDDTVKVLIEGDNVLIFPEKPRKVRRGEKDTVEHFKDSVGTLFTGFANIGKLYYNSTGKQLRFYPIYANRKGHTFKIGVPVIYDPENDPREEKQRITNKLHERMMDLSK